MGDSVDLEEKYVQLKSSEHSAFSTSSERDFEECIPKFSEKRRSLLFRLSIEIVHTYTRCNPDFRLVGEQPHRVLTNPSEPVYNNNLDNADGNLICSVNDRIEGEKCNYIILDILGTGTFGQVFRSQNEETKEIVAIKIIKNKTAYNYQGLIEIKVISLLNTKYDIDNTKHIIRLLDSFKFKGHICQVYELLSISLLEILTYNQFRGLPLTLVQRFTKQILEALVVCEDANVIHCDL